MKIAYNPIGGAILTLSPPENDITFDLRGQAIWAKGVRFGKYDIVSNSNDGIVPKLTNTTSSVLSNYYVLASSNINTPPSWYKLSESMFSDSKVTLSSNTENKNYRVLLSKSDNDTEETNTVNKSSKLTYNPSSGNLTSTSISLTGPLTITGIDQNTACINFNRSTSNSSSGYNYITAPTGGIISIQHGLTPSSSSGYHFTLTDLRPGVSNTYSLGTSSLKFKNVYANTFIGNLNGQYINALTNYVASTTASNIVATDSLNTALGKLEYKTNYVYLFILDTMSETDDANTTIDRLIEVFNVLKDLSETDVLGTLIGKYLPLTGGTLTGSITFNGLDVDRILMRINNTTGDSTTKSYYGFTLKYLGSGTGDANSLALFTDNSTASTQTKSIEIRLSGTIYANNIVPLGTSFNLGTSDNKWKDVYATNLNVGSTTISTDLGTSANPFATLFVNNINKISTSNNIILKNDTAETPHLIFLRNTNTDDYLDYHIWGGSSGSVSCIKFGTSTKSGQNTVIPFATLTSSGLFSGISTHIKGGASGSIPYQTAENTTTMLNIGNSGYILTSLDSVPTWTDPSTITVKSSNNGVFYIEGTGTTAGTWLGTHDEITEYYKGLTIAYKIPIAGTGAGTTLNINGLGAKACYMNTSKLTTHYGVNTVLLLVYDGTYFRCSDYIDGNTYTSAYCSTSAATAAKTATCSNYVLLSNSYLHVLIVNSNTSAGAITLNVNSKGAKPIYINGSPSSSSNYSLPAGTYLVFYDGTNYHFRTDGKIPTKGGVVSYDIHEYNISNLTLSESWQNTGLKFGVNGESNDGEGSYLIQISNELGGIWTGYFALRTETGTSGTSTIVNDEIVLQGGNPANYDRPYLRTSNNHTNLCVDIQIACSKAETSPQEWSIKYKRII